MSSLGSEISCAKESMTMTNVPNSSSSVNLMMLLAITTAISWAMRLLASPEMLFRDFNEP